MPIPIYAMKLLLLLPLAAIVIYYDVRFRRIPNVVVVAALVAGLSINTSFMGFEGALSSLKGLGLAFLFAFSVAMLSVASAWAQGQWGGDSGAILIALGGTADIDAAIASVGALPAGSLSVGVAALALAAPTFFNTAFKLGLFVAIAGWRGALPGAMALAAIAAALLIPIAIATT